nr:DEAD/DEAH box helicase [Saprospiraceae bacterium]
MTTINFSDLGLTAEINSAIEKMGFTTPSAIQQQAIPLMLEGNDIVGQAQTGTGKTAAFGIPLLQAIDQKDKSIQSLVVCPTRELAIQVSEELQRLSEFMKGVKILPVYGGEAMQHQLKALKKGVHIVVGTPGRVMDHMRRGTLVLDNIKIAVLDEADEMLNMGFREDIELILSTMPEQRQTVLFSATMPKPILDIAKKFQRKPIFVKVTSDKLTSTDVEQFFFDIKGSERMDTLVKTMQAYQQELAIVFCNTKLRVDEVAAALTSNGIRAEAIHGDLNQRQRNQVLAAFKSGKTKVLVATDVAARGIDVNDVEAVFNYDVPLDPEYYVHRIGRTGRAGKSGRAFSFVCGSNDFRRLKKIQAYAKVRIEKIEPPSREDISKLRKKALYEKLQNIIEENKIEDSYKLMDEFVSMGITNRQLSAALLSLLAPEPTVKTEHLPSESTRDRNPKGRRSYSSSHPDRKSSKSFKGRGKGGRFKSGKSKSRSKKKHYEKY